LLEEKGYPVKLQNADKTLLYNGVAQNRIDLTFEVWLPVSDKPAFDKVSDNVLLIGPWFDEAKLGLAVPDYVSIESIEQLNSPQDVPEVIVGIDSGSSLMLLAQEARAQYRLKQKIMPSSVGARHQKKGSGRRHPVETALGMGRAQYPLSARPQRHFW